MAEQKKNFLARAKSWADKNGLHGANAFMRFVMMTFVEQLNSVSDEFIFKGGNLLWLYIKTPRSTVDVDFVTKSLNAHDAVKSTLNKACQSGSEDITFEIASFREIAQQGQLAAAVIIRYKTSAGQENAFDLDVVYAIPTAVAFISAPIHHEINIAAATIENIVADKMAACQRFKSGNTRMKDFDDLWRISLTDVTIDKRELHRLLKTRGIDAALNKDWITGEMKRSWSVHQGKNRDLPDLTEVIKTVNRWLSAEG